MLRAIPDAQKVAALLADACARHEAIERNLTQINEPQVADDSQVNGPASSAHPGLRPMAPAKGLSETGLEGAPA
jgi:hypothetical protein